jgi:succinate--hydroxymethylglutarate CoA-transferase
VGLRFSMDIGSYRQDVGSKHKTNNNIMTLSSSRSWPLLLTKSRYVTTSLLQARHQLKKRGLATKKFTRTNATEKLPLAGIRVLDMTRVLAGVSHLLHRDLRSERDLMNNSLFAHRYLGTLGLSLNYRVVFYKADMHNSAEIIKIEHPTKGDDTRSWGPPDLAYTDGIERSFPGESAYYLSVCLILIASFLDFHSH